MHCQLDHLVIAAATLEQGVAYVAQTLGVSIPPGGEHPRMGTHNHVMPLSQDAYLEVIAVNPRAPWPGRPRWFGLDQPLIQAGLARQPRLLTWVVRVDDIVGMAGRHSQLLGRVEAMQRGRLHWQITVPEDGRLPADGFLPALIQWPPGPHPARGMPDSGCRLRQLYMFHPHPVWLSAALEAMGAAELVEIATVKDPLQARLEAHIHTPAGLRVLSSGLQPCNTAGTLYPAES